MSLRDDLAERILDLPGVHLRPSRFSDEEAFCVGRREFAHFHAGNELDLRLTRAVIRELREDLASNPKVTLRGSSDWIEVRFPRRADLDAVLALVRRAVEASGTRAP